MAKKASEECEELHRYLSEHFFEEFTTAITKYLNTDFTAGRMLGYIRNTGHCSMEMIVDEMLAIQIRKGPYRPKWSYFLRAESFYNVASAAMLKYNDDGKKPASPQTYPTLFRHISNFKYSLNLI